MSIYNHFTKAGYQQGKTRMGVDSNFGHFVVPTTAISGSITKFVDQIPQVRVTDSYAPHVNPPIFVHPVFAMIGSKTTYTEQLESFRMLDTLSCGDRSASGSITSFAGG